MIHHSCSFRENDIDHPFLGQFKQKPTLAEKGENGHLRCCECKRKVCLSDGTTHTNSDSAAVIGGPYPAGWCSDEPETVTKSLNEVLEA
jgi:hypothetical protein